MVRACLSIILCVACLSFTTGWSSAAESAGDYLRAALELQLKGDSQGAAGQYRQSLGRDPRQVNARLQLAILLLDELGDVDGAISQLMTALAIEPNCRPCQIELQAALACRNSTASAQVARGNGFYASGDIKRAMAAYRTAIYIDPDDATAHNSLAWSLYRTGELAEGRKEVAEALRLKPDDPEFINTLACLQFDQGDVEAAMSDFKRAISSSKVPNAADFYGLAIGALTRGDTTAAENYFSRAIKIDPQYVNPSYLSNRVGLSPRTMAWHERLMSLPAKK